MAPTITNPVKSAWMWLVLALSALIAIGSYRYFLPGSPGAAPTVLANRLAPTGALVVHIACAATALLIGPFQFIAAIRARWPRWHRRLGTAYVGLCLVGGLAALVLALGAATGPITTAGFGSLAIAWLFCTASAWRFARARDFVRHRRWMIRSFALTLAAVTLRLYLPVIFIAHLDFDTSYRAISFLCWVPNLIVAELWLRYSAAFRTSPPIAAASQSLG
jgi:uncharacterized membrane protein